MRTFIKLLAIITLISAWSGLSAVSPAVVSQEDYVYTLSLIRDLRIIVDNLGTDEQKKKYEELKVKFQKATEVHYGQNFARGSFLEDEAIKPNEETPPTSVELYSDLKLDLIIFTKEISDGYIVRTKEMLDTVSTQAIGVIMEYGKNSGLWKYFFRPIDPLVEKKPYDTKTYYYFFKRQKIEANLKNGYKCLGDARRLLETPDYLYISSKQKKTKREINFIIDTYMGVIKYCRQGKKDAIEIFHVLNEKNLNDILNKYSITMGMITKYPIYDDRVPEKYKPDAVDVEKMLFRIEKARVPDYDAKNKNESAKAEEKKETVNP
jgi:hypothetical protein